MSTIVLFVRSDCPLCAEAEALLRRLERELGFAWRAVNVENDAELEARYGERVPVLAIDGAVVAEAPLTERQVRRVLEDRLGKDAAE